ncbi:MAG: DUF3320 domain-containing protein, partial [Chloroflexota bacterium]
MAFSKIKRLPLAPCPLSHSEDQAGQLINLTQYHPMIDLSKQTGERLEAVRKELLDLGLRNPLLNFRPMRSRGVSVDQMPTDQLFDALVTHGKKGFFIPRADQPPSESDSNTSLNLPTPYTDQELRRRLIYSQNLAETFIAEQGINLLYLSLGMLNWRDEHHKERHAPLLLIPVRLDRRRVTARHFIEYTHTDWGGNLSLKAKLRFDHQIDLPEPSLENVSPGAYFDAVERAVSSQPAWHISRNRVELGFFSFNKFLIYNDLDQTNWPDGLKPSQHPIMQSLLSDRGFMPFQSRTTSGKMLDHLVPLKESHLVTEADSSQLAAILDVMDGQTLVIQGPPGTGKSQTITNLIAEALGQNKTVLFVAEKMAALEVVKRKLDQLGLGGLALSLHSHTTTKRSFAEDLKSTLELGKPETGGLFPEIDTLEETMTALNQHSLMMNEEIGESGLTLNDAYGLLNQLEPKLSKDERQIHERVLNEIARALRYVAAAEWEEIVGFASQFEKRLRQMGSPADHPFSGSLLSKVEEKEIAQIGEEGGHWVNTTNQLINQAGALAALLSMSAFETLGDIEQAIGFGEALQNAPYLIGINVQHAAWLTDRDRLTEIFQAGERVTELYSQYESLLIPEAWSQDVLALRGTLLQTKGIMRHLSREYRQAARQLAAVGRKKLPDRPQALLTIVDAILEVQRLKPILERAENRTLLHTLFTEERLDRIETADWQDISEAGTWIMALYEDIQGGQVPADILRYLDQGLTYEQRIQLHPAIEGVKGLLKRVRRSEKKVLDLCRLPQTKFNSLALSAYLERAGEMADAPHHLQDIVDYNSQRRQFTRYHLQNLEALLPVWPVFDGQLADMVTYCRLIGLVKRAEGNHKALARFDREGHDATVDRFRAHDAAFLAHNRYRLASNHWEALPQFQPLGLMGELVKEAKKRAGHRPVRETIARAAAPLQRLKPIFMMSPLSIARFLPPGSINFDLVIFDEASQIRPMEALGAIVRAKQAVVVGDNRQLPPTSFFERTLEVPNGDASWEDEAIEPSGESILDLFVNRGAPERMLRWHYRSQHESLITVSNHEFYNQQLVIFPSPDAKRQESGLLMRQNPDSAYDRGGSRVNQLEAEDVARAVLEHAQKFPKLTLGVATFSGAQQEAILLALESARQANPECEPFFEAHAHEPFFVKNLENVQGDERDIIFISVGYGRDTAGKVSLNFGPLNPAGGHRRLNVLITRSRRRCVIFTNLSSTDIDLSRTRSAGIGALKRYLAFAESGELPYDRREADNPDDPFADAVAATLNQKGIELTKHVGRGGVEVDIAVHDPKKERYRLALELDGKDYHRADSARDRDRIQQMVLERLGWQVVRLWGHAWHKEREAEEKRLLEQIESRQKWAQRTQTRFKLKRQRAKALKPLKLPPYQISKLQILPGERRSARLPLYDEPLEKIARWMIKIIQQEAPIHEEVLLRHLFRAAGYKTLPWFNPNRKSKFYAQILATPQVSPSISRQGKFFVVNGRPIMPRRWSQLSKTNKKLEYIYPGEYGEVIKLVVKEASGVNLFEVPKAVLNLLGFTRPKSADQQTVFDQILHEVEQGGIILKEEMLFTSTINDQQPLSISLHGQVKHRLKSKFTEELETANKRVKASKNQLPFIEYPLAKSLRHRSFQMPNNWTRELPSHVKREAAHMFISKGYYLYSPKFKHFDGSIQDVFRSGFRNGPSPEDFEIGSHTFAAKLFYNTQNGKFYHASIFILFKTYSGIRPFKRTRIFQVYLNQENDRFYCSEHDSMVGQLSFGNLKTDHRLEFEDGQFTKIKEKVTFKPSRSYVEASVSEEISSSFAKQEQDWVLHSLQGTDHPIHTDRFWRHPFSGVAITRILEDGDAVGKWDLRGEFVWPDQKAAIKTALNRHQRHSDYRNLKYVSDEEICFVLKEMAAKKVTIKTNQVYRAVYEMLGVKRPSAPERERIEILAWKHTPELVPGYE